MNTEHRKTKKRVEYGFKRDLGVFVSHNILRVLNDSSKRSSVRGHRAAEFQLNMKIYKSSRTFKDGRTCSPRLGLNVPEGFASFPETGVLIRLVGNEAFFEPKYETNLLPKDEGDGLILAFISSECERLCHCSVEGDFTLFKEEVRNIEVHL